MRTQITGRHPCLPSSDKQSKDLQTCLLGKRRKGANRLGRFHISNIIEISTGVNRQFGLGPQTTKLRRPKQNPVAYFL